MSTNAPVVSVIMANYNGAAHIAHAVRSVLRQTLSSLELIVSDDGSSDDSLARAREAAAGDERVVIVRGPARSGPAAARNRALDVARGEWIAIVDSDDLIHPQRFERLIAAAEADGADIAADDMLVFYDGHAARPHPHLRGPLAKRAHWISPTRYALANRLFANQPALGYLKPIFRLIGKDGAAARYDERLRVAEDFDLVMRLMIGGARLRIYPELLYFYRKHASSISHRLDATDIQAMLSAHDRLSEGHALAPDLTNALSRRRATLANAQAFDRSVKALKARNIGDAVGALARRPSAALLYRYPLLDPLKRRRLRALAPSARVALLSRQRVVGAANGSSSYLLSIAGALRDAGYAIDYVGASPKIFGRWPVLRLRPEMEIFARYAIRGGFRIGNTIFATDPRVALSAGAGIVARLLRKANINVGWDRPAAFAIAAKAERADALFVARRALGAQAIVCDYAFLATLAPFALAPDAPVFTVMHDLMSARAADPYERVPAEVAALTAKEEYALLGLADVVVAIQAQEAEAVREALPHTTVVVASHHTSSAAFPQIGEDDTVLFVGSNTAPNVTALEWFFADCWPKIRARRPKAKLDVAGSVARSLGPPPEGVSLLGVVPDLEPYYRDAGVVISPLRTGSGLKIKLIEALAAGKAVVGTTVTTQGVAHLVDGAMIVADDADAFAGAVAALLGDAPRRRALAEAALERARRDFSRDAAFGPFILEFKSRTSRRPSDDNFSSPPHSLGKPLTLRQTASKPRAPTNLAH
ncbi:MAG TPA: glycosyltransferase [Caulobacterales bacterium]|nr:glycosyltransferase [Caulobacterales bacterium]